MTQKGFPYPGFAALSSERFRGRRISNYDLPGHLICLLASILIGMLEGIVHASRGEFAESTSLGGTT